MTSMSEQYSPTFIKLLISTGRIRMLYHSMIKFFVLDVLLKGVVAVSSDPAPDSAFAPSFFGRPSGQLP
jgi:hypothetical protein